MRSFLESGSFVNLDIMAPNQFANVVFPTTTTVNSVVAVIEIILCLLLALGVVALVKNFTFQYTFFRISHVSSKHSKHEHGACFTPPIPIAVPKDFVMPPLQRLSSKTVQMNMGLKRLDKSNWLTIDSHYHLEHIIRASNLNQYKPSVLQCLPGSELACAEVLDRVSAFLAFRYPKDFSISNGKITNHLTREVYPLGEANKIPLETVARLAMEDFNILMKDDEGVYTLEASATLFPAGWKLKERIGDSIADLHTPVPKWKENIGANVNRSVILMYHILLNCVLMFI